ncbi:MAG TPA: carboxymuconolactone decarboxylase family protein, partial [Nevskiaceae bacterium]|nr:carboxymuconolactone decarboxylase family protein [Nevskiaceae bacterium]
QRLHARGGEARTPTRGAGGVSALAPSGGWRAADARLPVPPRGGAMALMSLFARVMGRKQVPDVFLVLHLNARLFWPWLVFASRLMPGGHLRARERELVILRTAWNCRSRYEWGQHVEVGLRVGLADAEIVQLARAPQNFADERGRLLLAACDELFRDQAIAPPTWTALAAHYDAKRLIEIGMLAGHYQMLAGVLNSAGLALEPAIESVLQAFEQRAAAIDIG